MTLSLRPLRSTIAWRVTAVLFLAILLIEMIVAIPSYREYVDAQIRSLRDEAGSVVDMISRLASPVAAPHEFTALLKQVMPGTRLKGFAVYHRGGRIIVASGETPALRPRIGREPAVGKSTPDRRDFVLRRIRNGGTTSIVVRMDSSELSRDRSNFVLWRIIGIGALALAVTAISMLMFGRIVLGPLLRIHDTLTQKSARSVDADLLRRNNEIGVISRAVKSYMDKSEEAQRLKSRQNEILDQQVRQRTAALRAALDEAEIANRAKSEFLANMSHELRTPLNAIIGFSEMMTEQVFGDLAEHYLSYAGDINKSGQHLLDIITDVLDISRIESGQDELHVERVPSEGLIESSVRLVRDRAVQAGVALVLALPEALPEIRADARKIKQVLINLLSNAVKFTPEGGAITVAASLSGASELLITVADTGIGMRPSDIPIALARFQQVDSRLARNYEGTGLGLPLAKALTEMHGGSLEIESAVGSGTTVTIRLPAASVIIKADSVAEPDVRTA